MKSDSLSDEIRVWGFENNSIVFEDGSLGFGFKLGAVDMSCTSDEEKNALAASLRHLLNGLPSEIDLQIVCDVRSGNGATIREFERIAEGSANETARLLTRQRAEMFSTLDREGLIPRYDFIYLSRRPISEALTDRPRLTLRTKNIRKSPSSALNGRPPSWTGCGRIYRPTYALSVSRPES